MTTAVAAPSSSRSGVVRARRVQEIPHHATAAATNATMAMAGRLPVPLAVLISAMPCQPRIPVPAASPRMVMRRPRADRIRIRMPMLATA